MENKYSAHKQSLNTFCKDKNLIVPINKLVKHATKINYDIYYFLNLHVLRLLNERKSIPKLDQSFIQNCMLYITNKVSTKGKGVIDDKELLKTKEIYPINDEYQFAYNDYTVEIRNYLALEISTCINNMLLFNFYKRVKKYLRICLNKSGSEAYEILKGIHDKEYNGVNQVVKDFRNILGPVHPIEKNIKEDPTGVLRIYHMILMHYELDNNEDNRKLFTLLPFKDQAKISYITVDKSVLKSLIGFYNKLNYPPYKELSFEKYFNIPKDFAMFKTDGKTVSILKKKETKETKSKDYTYNGEGLVIGIDPGMKDIITGYSTDNRYIKLNSKQYYDMIGENRMKVKRDKIYSKHDFKDSLVSNKTASLKKLIEYIKIKLFSLDARISLLMKKHFRQWRFTKHIKKQKAMNTICDSITRKDRNTIVGFGDWSNPNDNMIRGYRRGPVNIIKRELQKRCIVINVSEYLTSKRCSCCKEVSLEPVKFNGYSYRVRRCTNEKCRMHRVTVNRDRNAAINILDITLNSLASGKMAKDGYT